MHPFVDENDYRYPENDSMHFCSMQQQLKRIHNYVFTTFTFEFTA